MVRSMIVLALAGGLVALWPALGRTQTGPVAPQPSASTAPGNGSDLGDEGPGGTSGPNGASPFIPGCPPAGSAGLSGAYGVSPYHPACPRGNQTGRPGQNAAPNAPGAAPGAPGSATNGAPGAACPPTFTGLC